MTRSIYLHLSNDQDMGLHPNNVDVDFLVDLRTPLQLNGSWEVSLVAYKGPRRNEDHFVCCDTIQVSPVFDHYLCAGGIVGQGAGPNHGCI